MDGDLPLWVGFLFQRFDGHYLKRTDVPAAALHLPLDADAPPQAVHQRGLEQSGVGARNAALVAVEAELQPGPQDVQGGEGPLKLCKRTVKPVLAAVVTFGTWSFFTLSWRSCPCPTTSPAIPARNSTGDN